MSARTAVLGEIIDGDPGEPASGWFILGVDGYFDVDNSIWCDFRDDDAPWDSDNFDLHGTLTALLVERNRLLTIARDAAGVYDEHHEAAIHAPIGDPLRKVHTALGDLANAVLRP